MGAESTDEGRGDSCWIGVNIGGARITAVALEGTVVVARARGRTPTRGGPFRLVDAVASLAADLHVPGAAGFGVGVPGMVEAATGTVVLAPLLAGWREPFRLGSALSEALDGRPVTVDNDVNLGTLAEHRLGAARGADHVLGVYVGAGVGGALIQDGRLTRGATGLAGEIGHVVVSRGGRRCPCGGRGHLEAYAGRVAMERRARALDDAGRPTQLVELARARRMSSAVFAKALAAGDEVAVALADDAVAALGAAIASAVALLDVSTVVVGGGLAERLGRGFIDGVAAAVQRERVLPGRDLRVVGASLGPPGRAIGAALAAGGGRRRPPWPDDAGPPVPP